MKILVADDNYETRQTIASAVRSRGNFELVAVANGQRAMEEIYGALERGRPFDMAPNIEVGGNKNRAATKRSNSIESHAVSMRRPPRCADQDTP